MRLDIQHTWDGQPLPPSATTHVTVDIHSDGLHIHIDAPHHHDPLPGHPPGVVPGLWEFEVVEVFLAGPGTPVPYLEVEVGPGGHHLVLRLLGVRGTVDSGLPLTLDVTPSAQRWTAHAIVDVRFLPPQPWTINATAIHGTGDQRQYQSAVALPGDAPDFHQPARFLAFTPSPRPAS